MLNPTAVGQRLQTHGGASVQRLLRIIAALYTTQAGANELSQALIWGQTRPIQSGTVPGSLLGLHLGYLEQWGMWSVEGGLQYVQRQFGQDNPRSARAVGLYQIHSLQIPVIARLHINSILSAGFGLYVSYAIKDLGYRSSAAFPNMSTILYDQALLGRWEVGWVGSVRLAIPFHEVVQLLTELRVQYSFRGLGYSSSPLEISTLALYFGVLYRFDSSD